MVEVKVLKPFRYSPNGIAVVELEKGKAELPPEFVDIAVAEGWIEPPKKEKAAAKNDPAPGGEGGGENPPPSDPPAD